MLVATNRRREQRPGSMGRAGTADAVDNLFGAQELTSLSRPDA
jgi:hypothetical protein